jgi:hypothetical protein
LAFLVRKTIGGKDIKEFYHSVAWRETCDEVPSHRGSGVRSAMYALSPLIIRFRRGWEDQRIMNDAGVVVPTKNEWSNLLVTFTSGLSQRPELKNGSPHPGRNAFPGSCLVDPDLDQVRTPPRETAVREKASKDVQRELVGLGNDEVEGQRIRVTVVKGF